MSLTSLLVLLDRLFDGRDPNQKIAFTEAIAAYVKGSATESLYESSYNVVENGDVTSTTTNSIPHMFVIESIMIDLKLIDITDKPKKEDDQSISDSFSSLYSHNDLLLVIIFLYLGLVESKSFEVLVYCLFLIIIVSPSLLLMILTQRSSYCSHKYPECVVIART